MITALGLAVLRGSPCIVLIPPGCISAKVLGLGASFFPFGVRLHNVSLTLICPPFGESILPSTTRLRTRPSFSAARSQLDTLALRFCFSSRLARGPRFTSVIGMSAGSILFTIVCVRAPSPLDAALKA